MLIVWYMRTVFRIAIITNAFRKIWQQQNIWWAPNYLMIGIRTFSCLAYDSSPVMFQLHASLSMHFEDVRHRFCWGSCVEEESWLPTRRRYGRAAKTPFSDSRSLVYVQRDLGSQNGRRHSDLNQISIGKSAGANPLDHATHSSVLSSVTHGVTHPASSVYDFHLALTTYFGNWQLPLHVVGVLRLSIH